jgi:hypothetical protein
MGRECDCSTLFAFSIPFYFLQPYLTCVNEPKALVASEFVSCLSQQIFVRKSRLKNWKEIQGNKLKGNIKSWREMWRMSTHGLLSVVSVH